MKIKTILISDKLDSSYEERTSSCQLHKCKMHSLLTLYISLVYCFRFSHFSIHIPCLCILFCVCPRNRKAVKTTPQFENSPASFLCLPFLIMTGKRCICMGECVCVFNGQRLSLGCVFFSAMTSMPDKMNQSSLFMFIRSISIYLHIIQK